MLNKIYFIKPSSFCGGVSAAINKLQKLVDQNPGTKITCVHEIVHNKNVNDRFLNQGVDFVDNIDQIKIDDGIVAFSAHGTARSILQKAGSKFARCENLECPLVTKIYDHIDDYEKQGVDIVVYFGKPGHQEVVGVEDYIRGKGIEYHITKDIDGLPNFDKNKKIGLISQTTFNYKKVKDCFAKLQSIYPNCLVPDDSTICKATYVRQKAIYDHLKNIDRLIVIGGKNSHNTKELFHIGEKNNVKSFHVCGMDEILSDYLTEIQSGTCIGVTGGASTPVEDIQKVVDFFVQNGYTLSDL